jgi:hypothetical protein
LFRRRKSNALPFAERALGLLKRARFGGEFGPHGLQVVGELLFTPS